MAKAIPPSRSKHTQLKLESCRAKSGLSLEKIADVTKISIRFLRAIENEEYEKLPGGIFDRSYLRQYAASIGFEEAKLLDHYTRMTEPERTAEILVQPAERGFRRWFREAAAGR